MPKAVGINAIRASSARCNRVGHSRLADLVQLLVAGVSIGAIYAMIALGFVLLWQTSNTINFAQGEFVVLPAFVMVFFHLILEWPFVPAFIATIVISSFLLGWVVRKVLVTRLLEQGLLPLIIATIGLALFIRYSLQVFWTPLGLYFPPVFPRVTIELGAVSLPMEELLNLATAGLIILAVHLFITRTKTGWGMQAIAQNRPLAAVLGLDVSRLVTLIFILNAALAAVAAILIAPIYLVKYDIGISLGLKAFYAAIIGGFNQIKGAFLGGLLVGVVETLSAAYISNEFRDGYALVILIFVLMLKPEGIWGKKEEWA
jgi:branched-chain amino acid transport system permease protein